LHASTDSSESILAHNLGEMNASMTRLLNVESWGGNAGHVVVDGRQYSCAVARGYADPQSGKILIFGNPQDVPENLRHDSAEFLFRAAAGLMLGTHLVECSAGEPFTAAARAVLEESMRRWNAGAAPD
jgi:hypothetical protein